MAWVKLGINGCQCRNRGPFQFRDRAEATLPRASPCCKKNTGFPLRDKIVRRDLTIDVMPETFVDIVGTRQSSMLRQQRCVNPAQPNVGVWKYSFIVSDGGPDGFPTPGKQTGHIDPIWGDSQKLSSPNELDVITFCPMMGSEF